MTERPHLIDRQVHDPGLDALGQCVCRACWNKTGAELLIDLWREHDFEFLETNDEDTDGCRWQCRGTNRVAPLPLETKDLVHSLKFKYQHADDCIWVLIKQYVEASP